MLARKSICVPVGIFVLGGFMFVNMNFFMLNMKSACKQEGQDNYSSPLSIASPLGSATTNSNSDNDNSVRAVDNKPDTINKKNDNLQNKQNQYQGYVPASSERYIIDNAVKLGYDSSEDPMGCTIWSNPKETTPKVHKALSAYKRDLAAHAKAIREFKPIPDLLKTIIQTGGSHDVCTTARPHPEGLKALFPSNQLSFSKSGHVEPLTPPMRDQRICDDWETYAMNLDYLVHDFEAMCRTLKPHSKRVLIDIGASLNFHQEKEEDEEEEDEEEESEDEDEEKEAPANPQPIVTLLELYEKFGFHFDHIYGFEITFTEPDEVYKNLLPEKYMAGYHWINVGVDHEKGRKLNPLHSILQKFDEDDFIVLKLDVDNAEVEMPLARQLLADEDRIYQKLIDQFYFEHHVHLGELAPAWSWTMEGTVKESLDLFYGMREKGIPSHFWP